MEDSLVCIEGPMAGAPAGAPEPRPQSDPEGAGQAFAELWSRHAEEIRVRCLRWLNGWEAEAEEAFSRARLQAFQKFSQAGELINGRGWLLTVSFHVCMDLHRERRRRREQELPEPDQLPLSSPGYLSPSDTPSPEDSCLERELWSVLQRLVDDLPPRLREPIAFHLFREMGYREIAEALAITEVNVRKRMQQAREALRPRLQELLSFRKTPNG